MTKLSKEYNLEVLFPDLAKEWHHSKNGDQKPFYITPGSGRKVWWLCKKGTSGKRQQPRGQMEEVVRTVLARE